jgi:hypothetical protein
MDHQLCTSDGENATAGTQHISAILPQVLARYGIDFPPVRPTISSARLRRRMLGTIHSKSISRRPERRTAVVAAAG